MGLFDLPPEKKPDKTIMDVERSTEPEITSKIGPGGAITEEMLAPGKAEDEGKQTLVLSPTALTDYQACPRFFNWRKVQGYSPRVKPDYLPGGSLGHVMLATYYRAIMKGVDFGDAVTAAVERTRKDCINEFELTIEDAERLIGICRDYFLEQQYDGWRPIAVEAPFSKTLVETDKFHVLIEGIVDLVVEHFQIPVLPVDHKFKARTSKPAMMSNQYQCYAWALGANVFVENEVGVQIGVPKKGRFHRHVLNYEDEVLQDWVDWTIHWAAEIEASIRSDFFPPKFSSCHTFDKGCTFLSICRTNPKYRTLQLSREYDRKARTGKSIYDYREEK